MNNLRRLAVMLIVMLALVACNGGSSSESDADSTTGRAASSGEYPPMGVAELDAFLAEHKGTPTMLMFWTTWCPSCKQQIPEMEALKASHGDKVNIITVSLDEKVEALQAYFSKKTINLPVYHGDDAIARKFQVEAIPTLVMFDKDGTVTFSRPGVFPHPMLSSMADGLLEK